MNILWKGGIITVLSFLLQKNLTCIQTTVALLGKPTRHGILDELHYLQWLEVNKGNTSSGIKISCLGPPQTNAKPNINNRQHFGKDKQPWSWTAKSLDLVWLGSNMAMRRCWKLKSWEWRFPPFSGKTSMYSFLRSNLKSRSNDAICHNMQCQSIFTPKGAQEEEKGTLNAQYFECVSAVPASGQRSAHLPIPFDETNFCETDWNNVAFIDIRSTILVSL